MSPRRALLALAVAAAPLVQLAGMLPHPALGDTAAETLALVAQDPSEWFRIHVLSAGAAVLFVVAALALASLVRGRGAALATTGATMVVLGGGAMAIAFGAEAHLLSLAADPSLDRSAMVALAELEQDSPAIALLMAGFPLFGLGTLALMAGLIRSCARRRRDPRLARGGTRVGARAAAARPLRRRLPRPGGVGGATARRGARNPPRGAGPEPCRRGRGR
jgi:hypothetical protein